MVIAQWLDREPGQEVWLLRGLLSPEECADWIGLAEAAGFDEAPISTNRGEIRRSDVRNNDRSILDDPERAAALWARVAPHVPAEVGVWRAVGLNERFRFYRYQPGQYFAPHRDGAFERSNVERSLFTFMVFLNADFEGGNTRFFRAKHAPGQARFAFGVRPEVGTALLFRHPQVHEGARVLSGTKFALRSDVMFRYRDATA